MASIASSSSARRAQGIMLMSVAMLAIPAVDGLAKFLSADYSPLFLSWARFAVSCLVVLPFALSVHGRRLFPEKRRTSHILRTVFLVAGMTLYFLSIALIPLATAVSAYFVGPIVATLLAVVVLKERMTVWKAFSLVLGFVGSLVILRPGASMDPGVLLALGAGIAFAFYLIATRHAAQDSDSVKTLALQCVVGTVLLAPQALLFWSTPAWDDLLFFAGLGAFSVVGHTLSIVAFRLADASTLAPLVYVELIGATAIGYLAFGELPGGPTLIGAACIVAAGFVLLRQHDGRPGAGPAEPG